MKVFDGKVIIKLKGRNWVGLEIMAYKAAEQATAELYALVVLQF